MFEGKFKVLLALVQMEKGEQEIRTSYLTSIDTWFGAMKVFSALSLIESMSVLALIKRSRAKVHFFHIRKRNKSLALTI